MSKICLPKILLFFWTLSGVFAYDFSYCMKYYQQAAGFEAKQSFVSIKTSGKNVSLLFSPTSPKGVKIIKSDPFVGLYLIEAPSTKYAYHLLKIDSYAQKKQLSGIGFGTSLKGKILKPQTGFIRYAEFSVPIPRNGVVSNICYQIYGIGIGGKYFIDKPYLERFLNQKTAYYGDIGVRVIQKGKNLIVNQVDPFFKQNPFLPGDIIVAINNKPVPTYQIFEWLVSNLAYQKPAEVLVIRNNEQKKLKVIVDKRYGGFLLADSFLERFGILLDENLVITDINKNTTEKLDSLKIGDKIIWIDRKPIVKADDDSEQKVMSSLRTALSQAGLKKNIEILIRRNGLDFYIKL